MEAKKIKPLPDDAEQSRSFVETAKNVGADETGQQFKRAFESIVKPKVSSKKPRDTRK